MDNRETIQSHNTRLSTNNTSLSNLIDTINSLPEPKVYEFQNKSIEITENGTQTVTPDEGYDALNSVVIETNAIEDLSEEINIYSTNISSQQTAIQNILDTFNYKLSSGSEIFAPDYMSFSQYPGEDLDYEMSNLDTSNMVNIGYMFRLCENLLELDLSNFNTSKVTNMEWMFQGCKNLIKLNLSSFDFTNVTIYDSMFKDIPADCEIIVKDDTAKDWVLNTRSDLANVKTLAELEG